MSIWVAKLAEVVLTRAQPTDKATDETLLADNWQYIIQVCDKVNEDPEEGCRQIVSLIEKRLMLKNGNVLLRTLSLLTSVAENCGSRIKPEIATKAFTGMLLSKLGDPAVHKEIKTKIVQVLTQLNESFKGDPSLKPIKDAYKVVKHDYRQYLPPDKPVKSSYYTDSASTKEEEDLRAAIALSLQSAPQQQQQQSVAQQPAQVVQPAQQPVAHAAPPHQESKKLGFSRVCALYDSFSEDPADLKFRKGDVITVIERVYKDWGKGSLRGQIGLFPFNYVTPLTEPTQEEIQKDIQLENDILSQNAKVEKLLSLLTNCRTPQDSLHLFNNQEFRNLYQEITVIKPELAGLIEKFRLRKDNLLDLHKKLKTSTEAYDSLTTRAQPLQHQPSPGFSPSYSPGNPNLTPSYPPYPQY